MAGRLFIGTSGYAYGHWRHLFYPRGLPVTQWLPFYADRFETVELNSSFYRLPSAAAFEGWRRQVPTDFTFAVKASRYLTHLKRLKAPTDSLARLLRRARRLGPTLGPVLFQLPGQFHANERRLGLLLAALGRQRHVPDLRAVLEVRHASWHTPAIIARLRDANVALCFHDWRTMPVTEPVTADFVYIRRHGTRRRYGGSYPDAMLRADAARIRAWLSTSLDVYIYFNNDGHAAAVRNALRLQQFLIKEPRGTSRAA